MSRVPTPSKELISSSAIQEALQSFALALDQEYQGKTVHIVAVLKGAVVFLVDLMRYLSIDTQIHFVQASSYGQRGTTPGELRIDTKDLTDLTDQDVLLLDDIFDTGKTLQALIDALKKKGPRSLKTAVLLQKKRPRETLFLPDTALFEVDDAFVIGYGLDYKELYRNLPAIYAL